MLGFEDALDRLLGSVAPLPSEEVPLAIASGRVLAEPLAASRTHPPFDASAMDGYAVRWRDLPGPWTVIGEAVAGRAFSGAVGERQATRILTGAPVPDGADTVVVQEDVAREGGTLRLTGSGPPARGAHIRVSGLDFHQGDVLLDAGAELSPARIGLAAAGGHATVRVHRRARVALLATGDELVAAGEALGPGEIVSSNGPMLAALFAAASADVDDRGIAADTLPELTAAIASMAPADLIVTIGGASVGDRDLVAPALRNAGATIDFWKVAIRPGKPLIAGTLGSAAVLGLPGNPVSAYICAVLFALPVLRRLMGQRGPDQAPAVARLSAPLPANGGRRDHLRARVEWRDGERWIVPATAQDSSMLSVLADANALLVRPVNAPAAPVGERVPFLPIGNVQ